MSTYIDSATRAGTDLAFPLRNTRFNFSKIIFSLPILGVVFLVILPLTSFLLLAFFPGLFGLGHVHLTFQAFHQALTGYNAEALFNSFWVGASAGIIGTLIGAWLAWLTVATNFKGRKFIDASVWLILILPSYFMAVGWQILLSPGGLIDWHGLAHLILGPLGVMLVLAFKGVPFAYLVMISVWRSLPAEFDEAARVHGLRPRTRIKLILQILLPGLVAAFAIVYAESISDFGVAATLATGVNFPLATYAIYAAVDSQPLNFPLAAASSWLLLLLVIPAIWLQARINQNAGRYRILSGRSRVGYRHQMSRAEIIGHGLLSVGFLCLSVGIPLFSALGTSLEKHVGLGLAFGNLSIVHYARVLTNVTVYGALWYSLRMSFIAAFVTVALGLFITFLLLRRGRLGQFLDGILLTIMALPGLILAAGYIFTFNQPWLPLYGGSLVLGMAYVTVALPIASKMLLGPVSQQHLSLQESARVHGMKGFAVWWRIRLPLLATPILFAWLLTACHLIFELPASELLYPPGSPTLAASLVGYLRGFQYGTESALQLMAMALVAVAVGLAQWLFHRWIPVSWRRELKENRQ